MPIDEQEYRQHLNRAIFKDNRLPPEPSKPLLKLDPVLGFSGPYRFLSNFWLCRIEAFGCVFTSVEAAYQAAKRPLDLAFVRHMATLGPAEAKAFAKTKPIEEEENWHNFKKLDVMQKLVEQKFNRDENLKYMLLGTTERHLEEVNSWGDDFWGTLAEKKLHPLVAEITGQYHQGQNQLGKALMKTRELLRINMADEARMMPYTAGSLK